MYVFSAGNQVIEGIVGPPLLLLRAAGGPVSVERRRTGHAARCDRECEEINPREKPQNGTQENPEKPNRRRKGESPRVP